MDGLIYGLAGIFLGNIAAIAGVVLGARSIPHRRTAFMFIGMSIGVISGVVVPTAIIGVMVPDFPGLAVLRWGALVAMLLATFLLFPMLRRLEKTNAQH